MQNLLCLLKGANKILIIKSIGLPTMYKEEGEEGHFYRAS